MLCIMLCAARVSPGELIYGTVCDQLSSAFHLSEMRLELSSAFSPPDDVAFHIHDNTIITLRKYNDHIN